MGVTDEEEPGRRPSGDAADHSTENVGGQSGSADVAGSQDMQPESQPSDAAPVEPEASSAAPEQEQQAESVTPRIASTSAPESSEPEPGGTDHDGSANRSNIVTALEPGHGELGQDDPSSLGQSEESGELPHSTRGRPRVQVPPKVLTVLAGLEREKEGLHRKLEKSAKEARAAEERLREERAVTQALEAEVQRLMACAAEERTESDGEIGRLKAELAEARRRVRQPRPLPAAAPQQPRCGHVSLSAGAGAPAAFFAERRRGGARCRRARDAARDGAGVFPPAPLACLARPPRADPLRARAQGKARDSRDAMRFWRARAMAAEGALDALAAMGGDVAVAAARARSQAEAAAPP